MSTKLKPFRVSYYHPSEVKGSQGRVLLRSTVVNADNGDTAKEIVEEISDRKAVKAYPFYRNLKQPTRKTWIVVTGPKSDATKSVLKDLAGFAAHDSHEQLMDTFSKKGDSRFDRYSDPAPTVKDADTCQWHGSKYMVNGRCTKIDVGGPTFADLPASNVPAWVSRTKYDVGDVVTPLGRVAATGVSPVLSESSTAAATTSSGQGVTTTFTFPRAGVFDLDAAAPVLQPDPNEISVEIGCDDPECEFCNPPAPKTVGDVLRDVPSSHLFDAEVPDGEKSLVSRPVLILIGIAILLIIGAIVAPHLVPTH